MTLRIGGTDVESADDDSDSGTHRSTKAASPKTTKATKATPTKTRTASNR